MAPRSVGRAVVAGRPLVERIVAPMGVDLPVRQGQALGEVRVYERGKLVARSPLVAARSIDEPGAREPRRLVREARRAQHVGLGVLTRDRHRHAQRGARPDADRARTSSAASGTGRAAGLTLAGGKGINVARALKRLDVPVVATGLAGGLTGTRIVEELTAEAILNDFVRIADESRTSTAVVDPTASSYTEINEWGPHVEPEELEMLLEKLRYLASGGRRRRLRGLAPARGRRRLLRRDRSAS